jgi:acetate---CoA ligase (ADP-forming) subunit alpha
MRDTSFFFNPRSVAIIGASPMHGKLSHAIMDNLRETGYPGRVYPVNPHYTSVNGMTCYQSITHIKEDVDIAVVCVPAPAVLDALNDIVRKGVLGVIIVSAGFKEVGGEGAVLEQRIYKIASDAGIRIIGPNCLGIFDNISKLDTFFILRERIKRPPPGGLSILSQSGSFAGTIIDTLAAEGVGVSRIVNYGNRVDVGESDCLEYLAADKLTKVVGLYIESVDDGRRFLEAAKRCANEKPVFAIKVGRHGAGASAARSHTGAIAGMYEIYRAAFKKAGIIEARSYSEFLDACRVLGKQRCANGERVLIITDGGGMGASIADECEEMGLHIAEPSDMFKQTITPKLPLFCTLANPIDLTGSVTDDDYVMVIKEGLKEFDLAIVMVLWGPPGLTDRLIAILSDASREMNKPIVICSPGGEYTRRKNKMFEDAGLPVFSSPEEAARAARLLVDCKNK